jgi:rod shape-determining protein MreB and related proteins
MNERSGDVLAVGRDAWQMIGRTPSYIVAVRPLRKGAITDFDTTQRMIRLILERVGVGRFGKTRVIVCVPSVITAVERRAVTEAAKRAGATDVQLMEQPMAAAIGSGLPIHEPTGNMMVDVGGGTSETAVVSLGGIVALRAVRIGSFDLDSALQLYSRRVHGVAIGERTAEEVKVAIGSAFPVDDGYEAEVRGRDLTTGLPRTFVVTPGQVREALAEPVRTIVESVLDCLADAPPELAQDLIINGIHLVGGGSLLAGFDRRLEAESRVRVKIVDAPLEAVVLGAGKCLENFDLLRSVFMADRFS